MSPSLRSLLRNSAMVVGALGVGAMAWVSLEQILRASPFAKFGLTGTPVGAEVGVTLTNFEMKAYERGRLAAEAVVDKVEVRRDRSQMLMTGVRSGKFFPKGEQPLAFDMKDATYHYFQGQLYADSGAHVANKNLDLVSDKFAYDENTKTLLVRGKVQGKLAGGAVKADDFTLMTTTNTYSANNVTWVGQIDEITQDGQRREWKLTGNLAPGSNSQVTIMTNATATDGEIIVMADRVERTKATEVLVAKGNVKYYGPDANMLCDDATVWQKERRAVFTGVVRMVVKSEDSDKAVVEEFPTIERVKPETLQTNPQGATDQQVEVLRDSENIRKFPIKVLADKIEYWYRKGERRAVITGSPFARQDLPEGWRLGYAVEGFYDGEKETLTLKGTPGKKDVKVFMSIGDQYIAVDLTFSTKEGDDSISGTDVEIRGFIDDDEVPTRNTGGGGTGGGTTGGTTGGRR